MTVDRHDQTPIVVWTHPNGKTVTIYPDRKVRSGYMLPDEWPVLYRSSVPTLTDADWYAMPLNEAGWTATREGAPGWAYDNGQQVHRRAMTHSREAERKAKV